MELEVVEEVMTVPLTPRAFQVEDCLSAWSVLQAGTREWNRIGVNCVSVARSAEDRLAARGNHDLGPVTICPEY